MITDQKNGVDIHSNSYDVIKKRDRECPKFDREKIMEATRLFLEAIGEDVSRPGLVGTPDRVARMVEHNLEGMKYTNDQIAEMFNTGFDTDPDNEDLVVVKDITAFSYCEHHLAPIYDCSISIGYLPHKGRVIGLSKLTRISQMCAKRLQLQEKLGEDIADCVMKATGSKDVIVVINAKHACVTSRLQGSENQFTKTATLKGRFRTVSDLRKEFYSLISD